jgi:hypothetical protein
MARHGCLKPLVLRLKSRDIKVQCWSVCAVGNLCIENGKPLLAPNSQCAPTIPCLLTQECRTVGAPSIQMKTKRR